MSHNLLKGKRGIIFGALNDMSIAWKVAERAVEEGATITLSNTPIAVRMGQVDALAEKLNAQVIPAALPHALPAVSYMRGLPAVSVHSRPVFHSMPEIQWI